MGLLWVEWHWIQTKNWFLRSLFQDLPTLPIVWRVPSRNTYLLYGEYLQETQIPSKNSNIAEFLPLPSRGLTRVLCASSDVGTPASPPHEIPLALLKPCLFCLDSLDATPQHSSSQFCCGRKLVATLESAFWKCWWKLALKVYWTSSLTH